MCLCGVFPFYSGSALVMASGRFSITVKDVNGFTYLVQLDSCWSVQDLKHEVSRQASFSPDSFELVFAGSVLKESQSLSVRNKANV